MRTHKSSRLIKNSFFRSLVILVLLGPAAGLAGAATITVHTSPSFQIAATDVYSSAYVYSDQASALSAAEQLLADGGASNGWGLGAFGGSSGYQAQYLYFAFASGSSTPYSAVRLGSFGNQDAGSRTGKVVTESADWSYDNHVNDQLLLLENQYVSPAIPEPSTAVLLMGGLMGLATRARRRESVGSRARIR